MKKEYVQLDSVLYSISGNSHPECERAKMEFIKLHGIDPFELLGKCPEKYRYLLPEERQQLLTNNYYKTFRANWIYIFKKIANITLYTSSTLSKL